MLKTANNVQAVKALTAIGRAHAAMPGFDLSKAITLTTRLERSFAEEQRMHVVFALVALLLKGLDAFDDISLRRLGQG
jgi:hypothetical protein